MCRNSFSIFRWIFCQCKRNIENFKSVCDRLPIKYRYLCIDRVTTIITKNTHYYRTNSFLASPRRIQKSILKDFILFHFYSIWNYFLNPLQFLFERKKLFLKIVQSTLKCFTKLCYSKIVTIF